jgi:hypothetical protein
MQIRMGIDSLKGDQLHTVTEIALPTYFPDEGIK